MTAISPYLRGDRDNPNIERPSPQRTEPDSLPDETESEEYRADGLPKTSGYSVDKKTRSEPAVSTPAKEKEQSDQGDRPDYGF